MNQGSRCRFLEGVCARLKSLAVRNQGKRSGVLIAGATALALLVGGMILLRPGTPPLPDRQIDRSAFEAEQASSLPQLVLVAGLLVAALAALSVRYILISRLKSVHLAKSLALNAGIISSSAHLVIAIDPEYRVTTFNRAAENALGYSAKEIIGHRAIPIFLDPGELGQLVQTVTSQPFAPQRLAQVCDRLYNAGFGERLEQIRQRRKEAELLSAIAGGLRPKGKTFPFRGRQRDLDESTVLLRAVERELQEDR